MSEEQVVNEIKRLFIGRDDCYCIQRQSGYTREDELLTNEVLTQHLKGERTVGAYQLAKDSSVKYVAWDFDPEKLQPDPRATVQKVLNVLSFKQQENDGIARPRVWPSAVMLEASRFPDQSFHVWVFFDPPVPARAARWLGHKILELAGLSPKTIEVFPKQDELGETCTFGNFIKLPLGYHQVERKWSRVLGPVSFEPLPNSVLSEKRGVNFSEKDLAQILSMGEKHHVQATLAPVSSELFKPLNSKDEEKTVQFLCRYWKKGHRNELEISFLGLCIKKGVSHASAVRVIAEVCRRTETDADRTESALRNVDYHYSSRLNINLTSRSGLRSVMGAILKEELRNEHK